MTTAEAIKTLRDLQSQIIHGKNTFGAIADHIVSMESVLKEAGDSFSNYADEHRDKGSNTKEDHNRRLANRCQDVIQGVAESAVKMSLKEFHDISESIL